MRTADPVYRARLVAAMQQPKTFAELQKAAGCSAKTLERLLKAIPHVTELKPTRYQLDDGKRADLDSITDL
jgi:AraC-like DNA-binding protein